MKCSENREVVVYIDGTDWNYELGEACGGTTLYPSIENAKKNLPCWKSCGIVKVKVILEKWVEKPTTTKQIIAKTKLQEKT